MNSLLLVDADPLSLRVLDVSLRKAGYAVTTASDGAEALAKIGKDAPDLIVTDTRLREVDGFALVQKLRERAGEPDLPVILVASEDSADERARARDAGIDDYLLKPVFVRELLARVQLLLARHVRRTVVGGPTTTSDGVRLSGTTAELALVDLLQSLEASRTTGIVHLGQGGEEARIYLRDGNVVDAALGRSCGADVVYRTLTWDQAAFRVELRPVDNEDLIECTTQALLMRAMDRIDGVTPGPERVASPEPVAPAVDRERSVPSTAPWTREAASSETPAPEPEMVAAGVPHARRRMARRVVLVATGAGAALLVIAGMQSVRARQLREAERALAASHVSAALAVATDVAPAAPPAETPDPTPPAAEPATAPEATDEAPPPAPDLAVEPTASAAPGAGPAPVTRDPRETALDVRTELHSHSALVRDAQRALLKGDTAKAISLSQQAVATNGGDAEGWLTLAAARKAAGDLAGAREAYRRCIGSAHTFGVMSCRALLVKAD